MSPNQRQLQESVFAVLESYATAEGQPIVPSLETVLLGPGGAVDSLGLVRLILMVERRIESDFGVAISLTSEKAMSQRHSPFRTVGALIDYLDACLSEHP